MGDQIEIVGAGLAGSEAAWQLAERGYQVILNEMRPLRMTEAHQTENAAELVCSNTFKSSQLESAHGLLKEELLDFNSLIIQSAKACAIPAGSALAVDRERFSELVQQRLMDHPRIEFVRREVTDISRDHDLILAPGPLASEALIESIQNLIQDPGDLYFYDAIAPIIDRESLDFECLFSGNRYDRGELEEGDYLNAPLTREEYEEFVQALCDAEKVPPKNFEKIKYFEACMPVEAIAETGKDSLRFGPLKPVGLKDPRTGRGHYAVVQLRRENQYGTSWNLVGFQTRLKYPDQDRVFRLIPALKNAEFLRYGSIHRNTYLCAPKVLSQELSLKVNPRVYLAGQITGVEGYTESTAGGLLVALFLDQKKKKGFITPPPLTTALGGLYAHLLGADPSRYQPTNFNFGLLPPLEIEASFELRTDSNGKLKKKKLGKKEKRAKMVERARLAMDVWKTQLSST